MRRLSSSSHDYVCSSSRNYVWTLLRSTASDRAALHAALAMLDKRAQDASTEINSQSKEYYASLTKLSKAVEKVASSSEARATTLHLQLLLLLHTTIILTCRNSRKIWNLPCSPKRSRGRRRHLTRRLLCILFALGIFHLLSSLEVYVRLFYVSELVHLICCIYNQLPSLIHLSDIKESSLAIPDNLRIQFHDLYDIRASLRRHRLDAALAWTRTKRTELDERGSHLEFRLHQLQFLALLMMDGKQGGGVKEALAYARKEFAPFGGKHLKGINMMRCVLSLWNRSCLCSLLRDS